MCDCGDPVDCLHCGCCVDCCDCGDEFGDFDADELGIDPEEEA